MDKQAVFFDLGLREYKAVWALQHELLEKRAQDAIPDALILCEHPHVITVGRRAVSKLASLQACYGIPCYAVERGGDVTYHGPGQLVGYPILRLEEGRRDLHRYLRDLEEVLILALSDFGIEAQRRASYTGVWTAGLAVAPQAHKKIASIGVAVRRWVTYHGFALNVNTDLNLFKRISPCGLDGAIMTSMGQLLRRMVEMQAVKESVKRRFEEVFDLRLVMGVSGS